MPIKRKFLISKLSRILKDFKKQNPTVGLSASGPSVQIPLGGSTIPKCIRQGLEPQDKTATYCSDETELRKVYFGYANSEQAAQKVLYEEIIALKSGSKKGISSNSISIEELKVEIGLLAYKLPIDLSQHSERVIRYFKETGKINWDADTRKHENNRTAKVVNFDIPKKTILIQQASYFDQLATNIVLDTNTGYLPKGVTTIRQDIDPAIKGMLPPLSTSKCANTLGVAAMFYVNDFSSPLLRRRNPNMASIPDRGLHCTVSGVYEIPDHTELGSSYDFDILASGIRLEIENELNIRTSEYELFPVAFARELPRGGKPQLFFVARSLISIEELAERAHKAKESHEFPTQSLETFISEERRQDTHELFTYEGWACAYFSELFIEANELTKSADKFSTMS